MENESLLQAHWIILLSLLVALIYCAMGIYKAKINKNSFVDVLAAFFSTGSIISGLKLSYITLYEHHVIPDPANLEDSKVAYTIIGGCAVAWIAAWELIKRFKDLMK